MKRLIILVLILLTFVSFSQNTEIQYLSGTGADNTVSWEFYCSAGMNSGKWTSIEVPSCWEQQGFGAYNYGHDKFEDRLNETGQYKYKFSIPSDWKGKQINIVFDGVMTDASVKINGKLAGSVHQGSFYQFKYDITKLLNYKSDNLLEVKVNKHSGNESVNLAERKSDYWIFGGIFRPVFLEAKPKEHIERVAVDAKADGSIKADVYLPKISNATFIELEIEELNGTSMGKLKFDDIQTKTRIEGSFSDIKTWTPESPNLYNAVFKLIDKKGNTLHQLVERIGFRTVEVRENDGVYVNDVRIKMKGVNRHSFHPRYGRTSSKAISIEAVNLMKEMNMNAVRMSHYPPDKHFLDVCDSLGLFVLDELCAWQRPSYDDIVGRKLLEEMIAHDVNHPSIIFWDNGNEGGENNNLNDDFYELDIQKRQVLHPWQDYDKTNTLHYIDYNYLSLDGFSKRKIYFPTEFIHGLYDGGHGAGLDDYWMKMWNDPLCAGGFLWVFADEAIERTDKNRAFDTDGNHAPDGIVGPYHEKEGSFFTIKEIWAPIYFEKKYITSQFNGKFNIENRYHYTNLSKCNLKVEWLNFSSIVEPANTIIGSSEDVQINLEPCHKGQLKISLPENWQSFDAVQIVATDQHGKNINTWSWPVKKAAQKASELLSAEKTNTKPTISETEKEIVVKAGSLVMAFDKEEGIINSIKKNNVLVPLSNGPVFVSRDKTVKKIAQIIDENKAIIKVLFDNSDEFTWSIDGDGKTELNVAYEPTNNCLFAGISFDYPEKNVAGMKWLGNGPYRVYKNRMKGVNYGLWEKAYNNTITGESGFIYPEFKGYHANVYWVEVQGKKDSGFKVIIQSDDIFFRMLTPDVPAAPARTKILYPKGDISFLHGINAIGSKFKDEKSFGPQSNPYHFNSSKIHGGKLHMKMNFEF